MKRLSLRLRLTIVFTVAMAVVLAALGFTIYEVFRAGTNREIDGSLSARSSELSALLSESRASDLADALERVSEEHERFAQVLETGGALLAATPPVKHMSLLTAAQVRSAARRPVTIEGVALPRRLHESARILASPARTTSGSVIVVVGATLGPRQRELETLTLLLVLGGVVILLVTSAASYGVAAAALRPVEAMRRRAAAILPGEPDQRLPVSPSGDEVARLGATLNEMLERLQAAFVRERVFVADASHQLRTPLAILRAEIELALKHGRSERELRDALASAAEETDRLALLATHLLELARLDGGAIAPAGTERAGDLLVAVARQQEHRAAAARISLRIAPAPDVSVAGDLQRLEQALSNIVENALRFADSEVTLEARVRDGFVELHVGDDGPGFEPQLLGRAFERFARGSGQRYGTGVGLGLAIAAAIAQAHGGEARAANRPSGGADVWLALPLSPADAPLTRETTPA